MALYNLENKLELHTKKMDDSWGKKQVQKTIHNVVTVL